MKKALIILVVLVIALVVSLLFVGRTFYPDNIAETAVDGGAKQLKTRFYKSDVESAAKTAADTARNLSTYGSSWKLVDQTDGGAVRKIKVEVPVIVFTDDLEITIKKAENEHEVRVDVRSQSRVGKSDFGENARHVRKLLSALDAAMAN